MDYVVDKAVISTDDLKKILVFIRKQKGIDLTSYRQNFIFRRLYLRMSVTKSKNYFEYTNLLKNDPCEFNRLLDNLSINVTRFFRDYEVFNTIKQVVLPEMIQSKIRTRLIRIWSVGCASGEEPYSLAILMKEGLAGKGDFTVKILATDVDDDALKTAARAIYEERQMEEINKTNKRLIEKYFIPVDEGIYRVDEEIKKMVRFRAHNMITAPGFKYMDMIFCRNVLIYLSREQQDSLFERFYQALEPKGYLVIGKVETIWKKGLFTPVAPYHKIYQKISQ
ncbi:MAG: protein-glutamate O-methyltransferase CheR [Candidatus Omnitrophota bacterium]